MVFRAMIQPLHQIVLNTCPNQEVARAIAAALVERHLAACVNIVPGIESYYRWQGKFSQDQELLLIIKTTAEAFPAISECIQSLHPYELPEIIAVPIETGLPQYLSWLSNPEQKND
jgi:periplasmic divalent cation tolerance protein